MSQAAINNFQNALTILRNTGRFVSTEDADHLMTLFQSAISSLIPQFQILPTDEHGAPIFKSVDEAIKFYVAERDALRAHMSAAGIVEEQSKERMSKVSMWLRDKGDQFGVDSFKTQYGTAFRNVKTSYRVGDWDQFIRWVIQTDNTQCLEKRVAKNATKEVHDASGRVPPGIDYAVEVEFDVRRPTASRNKE